MPKEYSEWEWDNSVKASHTHDDEVAYLEELRKVQEWADSQEIVVIPVGSWNGVARPVRPGDYMGSSMLPKAPKPTWEVFASHADYPVDAWIGDFVGVIKSSEPPSAEAIAKLVNDWLMYGAE